MLAAISREEAVARDPGDRFSSPQSITQVTCEDLGEHVHRMPEKWKNKQLLAEHGPLLTHHI